MPLMQPLADESVGEVECPVVPCAVEMVGQQHRRIGMMTFDIAAGSVLIPYVVHHHLADGALIVVRMFVF